MTEITKTILALPDWKTDGNWEAIPVLLRQSQVPCDMQVIGNIL